MSYKQRVEDFWQWFSERESDLAEMIGNIKDYDAQQVVETLSDGLNIAIEDCVFETGGKLEINLATDGNIPKVMLTNYLVQNMPEKYRNKWTFTPWKPAMPGMSLQMGDVTMSAETIFVDVEFYDNSKFGIEFYNDALNQIDENQAYHIFYLVMDVTLGENIAMGFIQTVDKADSKTDSMIPLSELKAHMRATLEANEREMPDDYNPTLAFNGYSMSPDDNPKIELEPRHDIIAGFSRLMALLNEFYENEKTTFYMFDENEVKAAYLTIARTSDDHNVDLEIRNEISDHIEELLGIDNTGNELGVVTGQAIGLNHTYIDLLLYDEQAFMGKLIELLDGYDLEIAMYDFKAGAEKKTLKLPR